MPTLFPTTRAGKIRLFCLLALLSFILLKYYLPMAKQMMGYQPQVGDIIFQSLPLSDLTITIEGVSKSHYSHVGIVIQKDGDWHVREAIGPVMDTPLYRWILRGRDKAIDVYRLNQHQALIDDMIRATEPYMGRPYDYKYKLDNDAIYCSELVYNAFLAATGERLGELEKLGDLNWTPHAKFIEILEGGPVPHERLLITPVSLSRASQLKKVFDGYK